MTGHKDALPPQRPSHFSLRRALWGAVLVAAGLVAVATKDWAVDVIRSFYPRPEGFAESLTKRVPGTSIQGTRIETGSPKPPPANDTYTKCLEEQYSQLVKARRRVEAARVQLAKCLSDYKESRPFFATDAGAQAACTDYARLAMAHEASAKSIEGGSCAKSR